MTPTSFPEFLLYCGIVAGGGFLYFLGNLIFGFQQLGGKRLISFTAGSISLFFGVGIVLLAFHEAKTIDFGTIALIGLGIAFLLLGGYCVIVSFFGTNRTIEKVFEGILRPF
jgi:hypothetical protein